MKRETFSRHSHENTLVTQSWSKESVVGTEEWSSSVVGDRVVQVIQGRLLPPLPCKNFNNHFYFYPESRVCRGAKKIPPFVVSPTPGESETLASLPENEEIKSPFTRCSLYFLHCPVDRRKHFASSPAAVAYTCPDASPPSRFFLFFFFYDRLLLSFYVRLANISGTVVDDGRQCTLDQFGMLTVKQKQYCTGRKREDIVAV